jgi:hypothetical protein
MAASLLLALVACADDAADESSRPAPPQPAAEIHWPANPDAHQLGSLADVARDSVPTCGTGTPSVAADSVGALRPGATLAEVGATCARVLPVWDFGDEGDPAPALLVRLGRMVVQLDLADTLRQSKVTAIRIADGAARTPAGVGPGSSISELTRAYGPPQLAEAECVLYATFERAPGLSFRLDLPGQWDCAEVAQMGSARTAARLPPQTRVAQLIVYLRDPAT